MTDLYQPGPSNGVIAAEVLEATLSPAIRTWTVSTGTRPSVTSPEAAHAILSPAFAGLDKEVCYVMHLCTKHRLLEVTLVSIGSVDHSGIIFPYSVTLNPNSHCLEEST